MATYLSAIEAAQRCGVSPKTVRRWLQTGRLTAVKRGRSFRISSDQLAAIGDIGEPLEPATVDSGQETQRTAAIGDSEPTDDRGHAALVALVAELIPKAEAAAMWQARAEMLAGELADTRGQLLALQAPRNNPAEADAAISPGEIAPAPDAPQAPQPGILRRAWRWLAGAAGA